MLCCCEQLNNVVGVRMRHTFWNLTGKLNKSLPMSSLWPNDEEEEGLSAIVFKENG